jgi:23S rRNA (uracil1939-C5)-methyltransferase
MQSESDLNNPPSESAKLVPGLKGTVRIEDIAFGGDGVGRMEGMAVFVPFTVRGETVEVEIVHVAKRFARARLRNVTVAAAGRVEPPCPWFGRCAGCQYQHMAYAEQVAAKEEQVRSLLARLGGLPSQVVEPMVAAPQPWAYRSRITLHGPGRPAYVGVQHDDRIPVTACPIAAAEINVALGQWAADSGRQLADADLTLALDAAGRVWESIGRDDRWMSCRLGGQEFQVPVVGFFQVNPAVADLLVERVIERVRARVPACFIDAYAGVGVFGLLVAPWVERVWAIESDIKLSRAARRNARKHAAGRMRVMHEAAESALPKLLPDLSGEPVMVLLDPPRKGCNEKVLHALCAHPVDRVLYVSCAPDRLARDARYLCGNGYRLTRATPFDMFPQTAHIEVLAEFVRSGPSHT